MSSPEQTVHPFTCWLLDDANQKKTRVGGSYDNISAVTIACAVYQVMQAYSTAAWAKVAVYDTTDTVIAVVGGEQPLSEEA